MRQNSTIDLKEVENFSSHAQSWWDETGPFKPLHALNPVRLSFIKKTLCQKFNLDGNTQQALRSLKVLDVGCGGGLVCEPLARLGAQVTGLDPSSKNIQVATEHATNMGLSIRYKCGSIEEIKEEFFDVVLALEVVEHVANVEAFLHHCSSLLNPQGIIVLSTLNRTPQSFLGGIVAAEYILRWVPRGTHHWTKFIKPSELSKYLQNSSLQLLSLQGLGFDPLKNLWRLQDSLSINYFAVGKKI